MRDRQGQLRNTAPAIAPCTRASASGGACSTAHRVHRAGRVGSTRQRRRPVLHAAEHPPRSAQLPSGLVVGLRAESGRGLGWIGAAGSRFSGPRTPPASTPAPRRGCGVRRAAEFGQVDHERRRHELSAGLAQGSSTAARERRRRWRSGRRPASPSRPPPPHRGASPSGSPSRIRARIRPHGSVCGSLPFLAQRGTNPAESWCVTAPPRMKPRASIPATLSIFMPANGCTSSSTARRNARASPSSVVMSRNMIPGLGVVGNGAIICARSMTEKKGGGGGGGGPRASLSPSLGGLGYGRSHDAPSRRRRCLRGRHSAAARLAGRLRARPSAGSTTALWWSRRTGRGGGATSLAMSILDLSAHRTASFMTNQRAQRGGGAAWATPSSWSGAGLSLAGEHMTSEAGHLSTSTTAAGASLRGSIWR